MKSIETCNSLGTKLVKFYFEFTSKYLKYNTTIISLKCLDSEMKNKQTRQH